MLISALATPPACRVPQLQPAVTYPEVSCCLHFDVLVEDTSRLCSAAANVSFTCPLISISENLSHVSSTAEYHVLCCTAWPQGTAYRERQTSAEHYTTQLAAAHYEPIYFCALLQNSNTQTLLYHVVYGESHDFAQQGGQSAA